MDTATPTVISAPPSTTNPSSVPLPSNNMKSSLSLTKELRQERKISILLIVMALSHAVLTAPFNFGFLVFTNATDLWRDFEYRGLYDSIATSLYMVKYAKNFFLYCITNTEIRKATLEMIKKQRCA